MERRSFLFGAIAVPVGAVLPPALAEQLALPPPNPPTEGSKLLMLPYDRHTAVLRLSDFTRGNAQIIVLYDDGRVLGTYMITELEHTMEAPYAEVSNWSDPSLRRLGARGLHQHKIRLEMVKVG